MLRWNENTRVFVELKLTAPVLAAQADAAKSGIMSLAVVPTSREAEWRMAYPLVPTLTWAEAATLVEPHDHCLSRLFAEADHCLGPLVDQLSVLEAGLDLAEYAAGAGAAPRLSAFLYRLHCELARVSGDKYKGSNQWATARQHQVYVGYNLRWRNDAATSTHRVWDAWLGFWRTASGEALLGIEMSPNAHVVTIEPQAGTWMACASADRIVATLSTRDSASGVLGGPWHTG